MSGPHGDVPSPDPDVLRSDDDVPPDGHRPRRGQARVTDELRRRRGGLGLAMAVDLLREAAWTRRWSTVLIVILVLASLLAGTTVHYGLPWVVYGGL